MPTGEVNPATGNQIYMRLTWNISQAAGDDLHSRAQVDVYEDARCTRLLAVMQEEGNLIGAAIDHSKGTAYTYPTWIQLVFGKTLVFDRSAEKEGFPVVGAEPNSGTDAQAPSAPNSPAAANPTLAPQPVPAARSVATTVQPAANLPAQAAQPVTSGQPVLTRQPLMLNSEPKPAPSAQPQTQTAPPQDVQQRLEKLQSLRNNGLITQEEYQAKKKEILDAF